MERWGKRYLLSRTFLFSVIRINCQVLDILYQTEDGFAVPDEDIPPPPEGDEY